MENPCRKTWFLGYFVSARPEFRRRFGETPEDALVGFEQRTPSARLRTLSFFADEPAAPDLIHVATTADPGA